MIQVVASVRLKPGKFSKYLEAFKSFAAGVRKEKGCIEYFPAVDIDIDSPAQSLDENVVTIIEKWESLQALSDHLNTPQFKANMEKERDMIEEMSIKVLEEA